MLLGFTKVPYNAKKLHKEYFKLLKSSYHYYGEMKWTKVSRSNYPFYAEVVDYFFATDMGFRAIVIEKSKIQDIKEPTQFDDFYYKMYYQLIHHKLDFENKYNIYIDIKDTKSADKVSHLKSILQNQYGVIGNLQNIHSKESHFIQLTDFLIGAVSYYLRGFEKVDAKNKLINKIMKNANHDLKRSTRKDEDKFNLFFIELGK